METNFEPSLRVQVLSEKEITDIHDATCEVLEDTGVAINTQQGRKILLDAGCKLEGKMLSRFPLISWRTPLRALRLR